MDDRIVEPIINRPEPTTAPRGDAEPDVLVSLRSVFGVEPSVGVSIVDAAGEIRFANHRAAVLFLETTPETIIGRTLPDLYGEEWAAERLRVFERIEETGRPMIMRHIRNGQRLQSTIHLLSTDDDAPSTFLVVTSEGEHDPEPDRLIEVFESNVVHLGPLDPLSQRELEVLALVGHGMTAKQIGAALFRSHRTIEQHIESLRAKLHVARREQLAEIAHRAGLQLADATKHRATSPDAAAE